MIIDGKSIAEKVLTTLKEKVGALSYTPRLTIIVCNPNFETKKYLTLKEKKAMSVGIVTTIKELKHASTTEDFISRIEESVEHSDGIVVQLPLPEHVDRDRIVASIPVTHDVDALNPMTEHMLSPVVGAIRDILGIYAISPYERFVTIIGSGKLVGLPAYRWFISQGAHVSLVTRDTEHIEEYTKNADIVVCGAGHSGMLTPDMLKDGVVILDAGTSEDGGKLRGDALPECAKKARLFTPVPGGIGPVTIAILLKNVVDCAISTRRVI